MDVLKLSSTSGSGGHLQGEGDVSCHIGQAIGRKHQEIVHEPIVYGR